MLPTTLLSGLRLSDRPDAAAVQAVTYLVYRPLLRHHPEGRVPEGRGIGPGGADRWPGVYAWWSRLWPRGPFTRRWTETVMCGRICRCWSRSSCSSGATSRPAFRLIVPPIIQMLVFGYAATFEVYNVPTAMLDQDHSQESRELISRFTSSGRFEIVATRSADAARISTTDDRSQRCRAGHRHTMPASRNNCARADRAVAGDGGRHNSNTALIALGYVSQIATAVRQGLRAGSGAAHRAGARAAARSRAVERAPLVQPGPEQPMVFRPRRDRHA